MRRASGGLGLLLAVALAGCGGGGGGASTPPPGGPTRAVLLTTFDNPQGWGSISDHCLGGTSTGLQGFLTGPGTPPRGAGSYGLTVGSDGDSLEAVGQTGYGGTKLSDLSELTFAGYVAATDTPGLGPAVILTVDRDADGTWDDVNDDVLAHIPTSAGLGTWQSWNALGGQWCSGLLGACDTLGNYVSGSPGAKLIDGGVGTITLSVGCLAPEYSNYEVAVDVPAIGVGTTVTEYDLEP